MLGRMPCGARAGRVRAAGRPGPLIGGDAVAANKPKLPRSDEQFVRDLVEAGSLRALAPVYGANRSTLGQRLNTIRKRAPGLLQGTQWAVDADGSPDPELPTLGERVEREKKATVQRVQFKEWTDALRERARTEILVDAVQASVFQLPPYAGPGPKLLTGGGEYDVVQLLGDMQVGQHTTLEETGGICEYSTPIFLRRLATLEAKLVKRVLDLGGVYRLPKLVCFMLGDISENETIFPGQKSEIDADVIQQLFTAVDALAGFLLRMQGYFIVIEVICVYGNHGRVGKKGENKLYVNWDYIAYKFLESRLAAQPRIRFEIPVTWWHLVTLRGSRFLLTHGDQIKSWMGIPYYGIDRADANITTLLQSLGISYDYMVIGHHHNAATVDRPQGEKIVNGNWPGGSIYSLHKLNRATEPSQTMFLVGDEGIALREKILLAR